MRNLLLGARLVAGLLFAVAVNAQEGFPLDGTWRGERATTDGSPTTVVLIIQWDGKQINVTINPGPQGIEFSGAQLDPEGWKVHFDTKDAKGAAITFDGAISDLGKYDRVITGKWTEGGRAQDIRFVRE